MSQVSPTGGASGWKWPFQCASCRLPYPQGRFPHRCPHCGGVFDFAAPLATPRLGPLVGAGRGLSRFVEVLPLPPGSRLVSLGEGGTPLVRAEIAGRDVLFKCEYLNPTGSFKDRGTAVLVSALLASGVSEAVEDSSGNAGASFAAYAAYAGLRAQVFIPEYASGPKRQQIAAYGAEVIPVPGPRSAASQAVLQAVEKGSVYASHTFQPHGLAGMATTAFELVEELGRAPGAVVLPLGQGTLLLGLSMGFDALVRAGGIERVPQLVGVQASACAPLWALHARGPSALKEVTERETVAEGIRILKPVRANTVLSAVQGSGGQIVAVDEEQIVAGRASLGRVGFYVEPTSAVVWPALMQMLDRLPDPVVVILTGIGSKSADVTST